MNVIDIYPDKWQENLPEDVKDKLEKGLISKKEADIMSRFHTEAARNQILYECREIEKRYRKDEAKLFKQRVKGIIRDSVYKMLLESRGQGFKTLTIPDNMIENEIKEWIKVFTFETEEISPIYAREIKKEWEIIIRRWMKDAIKEGIEKEKEDYINKVWSSERHRVLE